MVKHVQEDAIHPDGWSRWIRPITSGYKLTCCDCGLVHEMDFRVTDHDHPVEFRVRRDNRATGQVRRHNAVSKVLHDPTKSKKAMKGRGLLNEQSG